MCFLLMMDINVRYSVMMRMVCYLNSNQESGVNCQDSRPVIKTGLRIVYRLIGLSYRKAAYAAWFGNVTDTNYYMSDLMIL